MFQNIGKKIKTVAIVIMIVGIVLSVLGGLVAFSEEYLASDLLTAFLTFLVIAGLGVLVSWLSVFILYGFGELVDQSMAMTQRQEEILRLLKEQQGTAPRQKTQPQQCARPQPEYPTRPEPQAFHSKPEISVPTPASNQSSPAPAVEKVNLVSELDRKLPLRAAEEKPRVPSPEEETDSDEPELYIPEK